MHTRRKIGGLLTHVGEESTVDQPPRLDENLVVLLDTSLVKLIERLERSPLVDEGKLVDDEVVVPAKARTGVSEVGARAGEESRTEKGSQEERRRAEA